MARTLVVLTFVVAIACFPVSGQAQQTFSLNSYTAFLETNLDIPAAALISNHMPQNDYYAGNAPTTDITTYAYFDSIRIKYEITLNEQSILAANQFMVTERLSGDMHNMVNALEDIFVKDLPVFISSDAILYALHQSYDHILMELEAVVMKQNLADALDAMYDTIPELAVRYADIESLQAPLVDMDLYICMAKSLLDDTQAAPHIVSSERFNEVWAAVKSEQYCEMPLFCERSRKLDFSQFTPRGHYAEPQYTDVGLVHLDTYFKAMMWLGRTDFLMTAPEEDVPWDEADIRRMCYGAVLVNELIETSGADGILAINDSIIDFMVGKCDNLTPVELTGILQDVGVTAADGLLDDAVYTQFIDALTRSSASEQRILSSIFIVDPFNPEPMKLPVSYRIAGQRFVVDSYTFSNVVYDRIINNGEKIWRPMPDPLDAMFALGNDDALHLLADELDTYPYAGELAAVRYLVDSYDSAFWTSSLYNAWLGAIRALNPGPARDGAPYFTTTAAWRQSQLATQLASWTQLRHDTLLYAKQSYTGGASCSYPHSYVEPNPAFFRQVGVFAEQAIAFFDGLDTENSQAIVSYFSTLYGHMGMLATLADKELAGEAFTEDETAFLAEMLALSNQGCAPPFRGWYIDLMYKGSGLFDYGNPVIADIHTQPTDEFGTIVGKVLHVATGNINLGVFLAPSPSNGYQPMAYVGPVQSYYEKVTTNFKRYTDEEWCEEVALREVPESPDWMNCYLADNNGNKRADGRMLPNVASPMDVDDSDSHPELFATVTAYPNPFNPLTKIRFTVTESGPVTLSLYTITGQRVSKLIDEHLGSGVYEATWNAGGFASGVYFCRLTTPNGYAVTKLSLVR